MYIPWLHSKPIRGAANVPSDSEVGKQPRLSHSVCHREADADRGGAKVEFRIEGKQLIVEKADEMPSFTDRDLERALRKAKKELIDLGRPRGNEIL